jgi:hypothetical protein
MTESAQNGYATPEQAACGDISPAFVTVVGARVSGDRAAVWLPTNDKPPFEDYQVNCELESARWHVESGFGGFGSGTPAKVLEAARSLGWR